MTRLPTGDVTLLFTDIEGSTQMLHDLGDGYGDVLAAHDSELRTVWAAHDGVVVDTEGDSFFVAFAQARAAVEAAADAQALLAAHPWPHGARLRVRMGMHTGTPNVRGDNYWGHDVHYAARVGAAAHGGQVLLSASTQALVGDVVTTDLGQHALKDFSTPRHLFALGTGAAAGPPPRTLSASRTNLPTTYRPMVGRAADLASAAELLTGEARLVTLTGVGGTGKSRLAIACGHELLDRFEDGVYLARLATVRTAAEVPAAIATALGVRLDEGRDPRAAAITHLTHRSLLLIADNFEHVLEAAGVLVELLEAAPGLRILVTSQAPLRLGPEQVVPLAPLAVEPAMALFAERARAADATFRLDPADMGVVREICDRLNGLPLGVELAAARVRLGGPAAVLAALDRGLDGLGAGARDLPERQRGLRAALDWTVSLLEPGQRELLATLAVFARSWTLELLEGVAGDEHDVWEGTAALMDLSLVRTRGDGSFGMAETTREYARSLLRDQGREDAVRLRHAEVLAAEAERLADGMILDYGLLAEATADLAPEFEAAMAFAGDVDPALQRRLVSALGLPYFAAGLGARLAADVLAADVDADPIIASRLRLGRSALLGMDDTQAAVEEAAAAVALVRPLGDELRLALTLVELAHFCAWTDAQAGLDATREAEALAVTRANRPLRMMLLVNQGANLALLGRIEEAEACAEAVIAADEPGLAKVFAATIVADAAFLDGRYETAAEHYGRCLAGLPIRDLQNRLLQCYGVACALIGLGRDAEAIQLMAAIQQAGEREGATPFEEDLGPGAGPLFAAARERLGPGGVAEAQRQGRELDLDALIERSQELAASLSTAAR